MASESLEAFLMSRGFWRHGRMGCLSGPPGVFAPACSRRSAPRRPVAEFTSPDRVWINGDARHFCTGAHLSRISGVQSMLTYPNLAVPTTRVGGHNDNRDRK